MRTFLGKGTRYVGWWVGGTKRRESNEERKEGVGVGVKGRGERRRGGKRGEGK